MKTKDVNNAIENWLGGHADRSAQDWLIDEMKKDAFLDGYDAPFIKKLFKGKSSIGRACGGKFDDGDTCALFAIFLIKLCSRCTIGKDALDLALG